MSFTDKFDKEDYYFSEEGYLVFTEAYHLKRGFCCHNNCKHCPYKEKKTKDSSDKQQEN
jgi:hypothetical protein